MQKFATETPINGEVSPGVIIKGAGLALEQRVERHATPEAVHLTNHGTITADDRAYRSVVLVGNGDPITYRGTGAVTNTGAGGGILAKNSGDIRLVPNGSVIAGDVRKTAPPPGLRAIEYGTGNIVIGGAGSVIAPAGRGIWADQGLHGLGGVLVTGTGNTAGLGFICPGVGNVGRAISRGKIGCSGILGAIRDPANSSDVVIDRSGDATGTSTALHALTAGDGNVVVTPGKTARIVGVYEFGIEAQSMGAGQIMVGTGANSELRSGGDGIYAINVAKRLPASAGSSITVDAKGTITSGSLPIAALNPKNPTGTLAGISAGYAGGRTAGPNTAVHGSVNINNSAVIQAEAGDGILGYNFGAGPTKILTTGPVTAPSGNGISALGTTRPIDVMLRGPGAIVTGAGPGHAALSAQTMGGRVRVEIGAGAALLGGDEAAGILIGTKSGKATIENSGTIAGGDSTTRDVKSSPHGEFQHAGIVGPGLTILNKGTIAGGSPIAGVAPEIGAAAGSDYAIVSTGGVNRIGGPGAIVGGIDVTGASSLRPALAGSILGSTLAVNGPLRFSSTSTYDIRIKPSAADSTTLSGAATLNGGQVKVVSVGASPRPRTRYTILAASDGIVGTFKPEVATNLLFFRPTLSYGVNEVFLNARYDYRNPASTQNEADVGASLNSAAKRPRSDTASTIFGRLKQVPTSQGPAVLDALSGEGLAAARNVAQRSAELFTSTIFDQMTFYRTAPNSITLTDALPSSIGNTPVQGVPSGGPAEAPSPRTWRVWATGFGGAETIKGRAVPIGSATQDITIYGGTLGLDDQLTANDVVGLAVGASDGRFDVSDRGTSGSTNGGHVALYNNATFSRLYIATSGQYSQYDNRTNRTIGFAAETERGKFSSDEWRTRMEVGQHFDGFGGVMTPYIAAEVADLRSRGFSETDVSGPGLFGLTVSRQSAASVPGIIGARFQLSADLGRGVVLSPTLQVAYAHEFAPDREQKDMISGLPGSSVLVDGARPSRNTAQLKAGGEVAIGPYSMIFADFDGEFSGVERSYAGKGGFKYLW